MKILANCSKPLIVNALLLILLLPITQTYAPQMPKPSQPNADRTFWNSWYRNAADTKKNFDYTHSVIAVDIDQDGDLDVLGTTLLDGDMIWWENVAGDASSWREHLVPSTPNPEPPF